MSDALVGILVGLFFPLAISGFFYLILGLISRNLERTQKRTSLDARPPLPTSTYPISAATRQQLRPISGNS